MLRRSVEAAPKTGHSVTHAGLPFVVESGCGAVAVGSAYLFPPLSSGGASIAEPITPFPHPAHRTGRALLTHPALGQGITPSHTEGHEQPSDQPPGPWYPSVLRSTRLLATANATTWGDSGSLDQRPGSPFASACGTFRNSHTSTEFSRVAPISRALPLPAPALNQGPFPPPALPGLLSNTGLSATP